jgi:signal transduction histidine kinase
MSDKYLDNRVIIIIELVFLIYVCFAFYHLAHKPFVPQEFASLPTLQIDGTAVESGDDIEFLLSRRTVGDSITVSAPPYVESHRISITNYAPLSVLILDAVVIILIFGLGGFVYFRRQKDRAALIFHIAATTVATAIIGTKTIYVLEPPWLGYILCFIFFVAYSVGPVLFLHFTFVFPYVRWKKFLPFIICLYCAAVILSTWHASMYLHAAGARSYTMYLTSKTAGMLQNGFIFFILILGIINFIISYKNTPSLPEKKKIRWLLFGIFLGTVPFVFFWALPISLGYAPWVSENLLLAFLLIIPATFSIAILKYHAMDIDIIINRSIVYVIAVGIGLGIYLMVVGVAAKIITSFSPQTSLIISTVTAAIIALLFEPARRKVQHIVDRLFFRVQYDFRQTQKKLIEEIKQCVSIRDLAQLVVDRTDEILPVGRIGFFRLFDHGLRFRLIAHKNFDIPGLHNIPFEEEKLRIGIEYPLALPDRIDAGVMFESADTNIFNRWKMALVFPMALEQKKILGFLALGEKKSGMKYTAEDIDLLRWITAEAGMKIERIELQQKLLLEQAETQRLEELNRLKSYFVSSVSHDLKTPITSIKMFAELLRTKKTISKRTTKEYLEIIEGESERLTRLINNVLDFARMERGEKEYHFYEIDLNSLVQHVLRIMKYQFRIEKCVVHEQLCEDECIINADNDAVIEALINLLSNAMKYSHDEKEISVLLIKRDRFASLQVIDKGIGIATEDMPHIFEPFFRSRGGKIHGAGGAGLGLAIVKQVTDAHGGKVEVKSTPGKGSTFTLLFPLSLEA